MVLKKPKKGSEVHPVTGLSADFFKQFKSKESFEDFFQTIFKQGIETLLQGELDAHLVYEKSKAEGYNTGNSRNIKSSKNGAKNTPMPSNIG